MKARRPELYKNIIGKTIMQIKKFPGLRKPEA